jgi:hypothetical protein
MPGISRFSKSSFEGITMIIGLPTSMLNIKGTGEDRSYRQSASALKLVRKSMDIHHPEPQRDWEGTPFEQRTAGVGWSDRGG